MPFPKFDLSSPTPAKVAKVANQEDDLRPAQDSLESPAPANPCESVAKVAKDESGQPVGFAGFAEIRNTFANPANRENDVLEGDSQDGFADSQDSQGGEPKREALTARLLQAGAALGWKQSPLEGWQSWAATAPLEALQARVSQTEARLHLRRDPDPSGCPTHWQRVPLLPEKGQRVALQTPDGYGALYRFRHAGGWYILKFLPPFDGRLSLRNEQGQTWVFPSLDDLGRYLSILEEDILTI